MRAKILTLKSFFLKEIYNLRQEFHLFDHNSNQKDFITHCVGEEKDTNEGLKAKLHSCQKENQLLKEEIENKQKTIETILNQNNELLKYNHYFDQNRMGKKDGKYKVKEKGKDSEQDGN